MPLAVSDPNVPEESTGCSTTVNFLFQKRPLFRQREDIPTVLKVAPVADAKPDRRNDCTLTHKNPYESHGEGVVVQIHSSHLQPKHNARRFITSRT
jgi:hypothetical protein